MAALPPDQAVERFLAQFPAADRAEAVTIALMDLRTRTTKMLIVCCQLAYEAHEQGYWSKVRRADGTPFETEEDYFREILDLTDWRSALKRVAVGRMLAALPPATMDDARKKLPAIGLAKATVIAPVVITKPETWPLWFDRAETWRVDELQEKVSESRGAKARGVTAAAERFRAYLLNHMPSANARAVLEQLFEVGVVVVESENPLAIVVAAFEEALSTWSAEVDDPRAVGAAPAPPPPREATPPARQQRRKRAK